MPYDTSTQGLLAPTQSESQRIAGIVMPVLKQAYESQQVDEQAIRQAIDTACPPDDDEEPWYNVVEIHRTKTPKGRNYGFRMESEFALGRDWWDVYVDVR